MGLLSSLFLSSMSAKDGVDADVLPNGSGEFGLTETNPVPTSGVTGSKAYLSALQTVHGERLVTERIWSVPSPVSPHPVDEYAVTLPNGTRLPNIFISMYHRRNSRRAPKGFVLSS